jgi:hypothetical protein
MRINTRFKLAAVATIVVMTIALPGATLAGPVVGDAVKTTAKLTKERGPKDKITTTCAPGTPDYDPDQCYKDIKDK